MSLMNRLESFCRQHIKNFDDFETFISPGIPYETIISKATDEGADLIVIGTHGRTGLDHVLFGSTAEKVVRKSSLPVLSVRLDEN